MFGRLVCLRNFLQFYSLQIGHLDKFLHNHFGDFESQITISADKSEAIKSMRTWPIDGAELLYVQTFEGASIQRQFFATESLKYNSQEVVRIVHTHSINMWILTSKSECLKSIVQQFGHQIVNWLLFNVGVCLKFSVLLLLFLHLLLLILKHITAEDDFGRTQIPLEERCEPIVRI